MSAPRLFATRLFFPATAVLTVFAVVSSAFAADYRHPPAPPLVRSDLQGRTVDLSALRGRVVLLTFWATWCIPCQVEMPRFIAWQSRYQSRGLALIGVSMDDDEAQVRAMTAQRPVNYPIVMGDADLARLYGGVMGLPVTFLIDRQGRIAQRFEGETNLTAMERAVRRLLDKP